AKTSELRRCGGYPDFTRGNHNENALLIKVCIGSSVVFGPRCLFRWRVDHSSNGWSVSAAELAAASREFMYFLEQDPILHQFATAKPGEWKELRALLVQMAWETYLDRWKDLYRSRMSSAQWTKAAFAMPFIPGYYRSLAPVFLQSSKEAVVARIK